MKFDQHRFWKHENSIDCFYGITSVAFDDDGKNAVLWGSWWTQGVERHRPVSSERLKIDSRNYDLWKEYEPKGKAFFGY